MQQAKAQTVIYIDSSVSVSGNGRNWVKAFKTLSEGLFKANADTGIYVIKVAKGTYFPSTNAGVESAIRDSSFRIVRNGIQISGGFPNGGGAKNILLYPTILSGDIGIKGSNADNSYHVLTIVASVSQPAIDSNTIVDGCLLKDGNANGTLSFIFNGENIPRGNGGGVYNFCYGNSLSNEPFFTPVFNKCTFNDNSASLKGGGMCNEGDSIGVIWYGNPIHIEHGSQPVLNNCSFNNNQSGVKGGAIYDGIGNNERSSQFNNCSFNNNFSKTGGALYANGSGPYGESLHVISDCSFNNNYATNGGGAICNDGSADGGVFATINNCSFYNNYADTGGAIYNFAPTESFAGINSKIQGCLFSNNKAKNGGAVCTFAAAEASQYFSCIFTDNNASTGNGGAMLLMYKGYGSGDSFGKSDLFDCLFVNNSSGNNGGAISGAATASLSYKAFLRNTTFYNNRAANFGSTIFGSSYLDNCIVWENTNYNVGNSALNINTNGVINLRSTLLQGTVASGVSLDAVSLSLLNIYPLFVDTINLKGTDQKWATKDDGLELKKKGVAFNKGVNSYLGGFSYIDITGSSRIQCDTVDLGAYEIKCHAFLNVLMYDPKSLQNKILLYPNPARKFITVQGINTFKTLTIFDMTGKRIWEQKIVSSVTTVDIEKLKNGIYLLRFEDEENINTLKLIKQ